MEKQSAKFFDCFNRTSYQSKQFNYFYSCIHLSHFCKIFLYIWIQSSQWIFHMHLLRAWKWIFVWLIIFESNVGESKRIDGGGGSEARSESCRYSSSIKFNKILRERIKIHFSSPINSTSNGNSYSSFLVFIVLLKNQFLFTFPTDSNVFAFHSNSPTNYRVNQHTRWSDDDDDFPSAMTAETAAATKRCQTLDVRTTAHTSHKC